MKIKKRMWSEEERRFLMEAYPSMMPCEEIARMLGRPVCSIYTKAQALGLRKPKEFFYMCGKRVSSNPRSMESRYKKGCEPANKGKKMSPELYDKVKRTMFQPGNIPANHREVGSERINTDGYIEVKVAEPSTWRLKHRVVWESVYGDIPPGHNVQFRNVDRHDCRIENLYLISREEQLVKENSLMARYPKELQDVIRLKGCVNRQINKLTKKGNGK